MMMQEIKTPDDTYPYEDIKTLKYENYVFGQKSYNGVAIVSKKKFLNKNDLKQIEFAKNETKPIYNNSSFMYEFLTSFRDKINAPFKKKDK